MYKQYCGCAYPNLLRFVLSACLALTVYLTWPLWESREYPPLLPFFNAPQINFNFLLLSSCITTLVIPRVGVALCWFVFLCSMCLDQTRIQPQIFSMLMLMLGTIGSSSGVLISRSSLVSQYSFAGLHKLVSPGYYTSFTSWIFGTTLSQSCYLFISICFALSELAIGLGCFFPKFRKVSMFSAVLLHSGTLITLSPLFKNWNSAVWPWNFALLFATPCLVTSWQGKGFGNVWLDAGRWTKAWACSLILMPAGYYLGITDANLSSCLYSYNTPKAFICTAFNKQNLSDISYEYLNVPLPPARRLFYPFFSAVGRSGTWLQVDDPRWFFGGQWKTQWDDIEKSPIEEIVIPVIGNTTTILKLDSLNNEQELELKPTP